MTVLYVPTDAITRQQLADASKDEQRTRQRALTFSRGGRTVHVVSCEREADGLKPIEAIATFSHGVEVLA